MVVLDWFVIVVPGSTTFRNSIVVIPHLLRCQSMICGGNVRVDRRLPAPALTNPISVVQVILRVTHGLLDRPEFVLVGF